MWFKSQYTKHLEAENERLLQENRALLNSVLVNTGLKPVERSAEAPQPIKRRLKPSWFQWQMKQEQAAEKAANQPNAVPETKN
jgi:hypothetical protein